MGDGISRDSMTQSTTVHSGPANGQPIEFTETVDGNIPRRFYRMRLP
jgi:hypothetical protein